jgi:outer membrane protein
MKKILLGTFISLFFLSSPVLAQTKIGIVDTQVIISTSKLYSELRKAEGELAKLQENFQKDYMDKMNKLQQAKNKEEFERLQKQFQGELLKKRDSAMKTLQSKQKDLEKMKNDLRKKVEIAINNIAKSRKFDYVVDKQAMFYGGIDITQEVLSKIK